MSAQPSIPNFDARVVMAQDGDRGAFSLLYQDNVSRIYALAARMCGRSSRAEELTQDVFVKAWRHLHTFRGEAKFSTWLRRLAVHTIIDGLRRDRHVATDRPLETDVPVPPRRVGDTIDLERTIAKLPPKARQVFVLHDLEGYKHDEIAQLMGTSAGTSRGQLHRARRLLREALEHAPLRSISGQTRSPVAQGDQRPRRRGPAVP